MVSEKFRRQLRQEAEQWWHEGLIDASAYGQLADRYQFSEIDSAARNRFTAILMGLGGILMGLGTITFVAAHWEDWSRLSRLFLLLSLFFGVNATGFYLWRQHTLPKSYQNLGQGLLLLGALILGANMALMSQIFHQSGNLYELFLVWGLGVMLMSFSLRLTSLGVLAGILLQIGYWLGFFGSISSEGFWGKSIIEHMPLVVMFFLIPLAYWCRSRVIFALSSIAIITSLLANLLRFEGWMIEVAIGLPPALFWTYTDRIWKFERSHRSPSSLDRHFQSIARSLSTIFLSLVLYVFSFNIWKYLLLGELSWEQWQSWRHIWIDLLILIALTLMGWLQLRSPKRRWQFRKNRAINSLTIAITIFVSVSLAFWHWHIQSIAIVNIILFNLMLLLFSISLIRDGLALGVRRTFWGGTFLLAIGIVSRMLEYNTGLLLKSLVFVLCGVGVMIAGLAFEQNVKKSQHLSIPNSSEEEAS
jgi:uncharacterized membrane protein